MDGLIIDGLDDAPRPLLAIIERSEAMSLAGLVRQSLDGVDRLIADTVLVSVTHAHERLSPTTLARLVAQPRRALTLRLVDGGFPPPQRLLTWGRLIVAAHTFPKAGFDPGHLEDLFGNAVKILQKIEAKDVIKVIVGAGLS